MKLQYLAVIFIIIFFPILLVTTYYVQQQMETINNQLEYDAALLDATHDAMIAFEINTANEDLSTVSDSLRSIIEASNNIFLNTLAVNFGVSNASKSVVQPYIPAVLYTLYDGYYIYSPTNTPIVCTDKYGHTISTDSYGISFSGTRTVDGKQIGIYEFDQSSIEYGEALDPISGNEVDYEDDLEDNGISYEYGQMLYENTDGTYSTVINENTKYKTSYILKSYVPYAAQYTDNSTYDIIINYTLDNYMTILGDIGGTYYSKSGYLIDQNLIEKIEVTTNGEATQTIEWYTYSDEELNNMANDPEKYEVKIIFNADVEGNKVEISNRANIIDGQYWDDAKSAVAYYSRAWAFSQWLYSTDILNTLEEKDIEDRISQLVNNAIRVNYKNVNEVSENLLYDFENSDNVIFGGSDPEDFQSNFAEHKRNVIKNSITYNLSLAMNVYNEKYSGMAFEMPVLNDEEWDKLLSNVSILTFMQGLKCGYKTYNNYALVCSTNNEITVTPEEIYYTNFTVSLVDGDQDYNGDGTIDGVVETVHRINCPKLVDSDYYTSLKSKEIKYDKNYNSLGRYDYDHKVYTCYDCLVNANYKGISGQKNGTEGIIDSIYTADATVNPYFNKLRAYYIAIGKERQNLYKPTSVSENNSIEIINFKDESTGNYNVDASISNPVILQFNSKADDNSIKISTYPINRIAKIDVTFEDTCKDTGNPNLYTTLLIISLNGNNSMEYNQVVIPVNSTTTKTIELGGSFESADTEFLTSLGFEFGNSAVNLNVKSVKIYYK